MYKPECFSFGFFFGLDGTLSCQSNIFLYPTDIYHFMTLGGFYHLALDDSGEVEGIRFSAGPSFILTMEKIH
jgi:hypothetical protein